jgi:HEAT repeat protein
MLESEQNSFVLESVVDALGEIGEPSCVPDLIKALDRRNQNIRQNVIQALKRIGTPEALAAVSNAGNQTH